jgi:DHA1 family tetracycline resistance protein-like MFS transporter
METRQKTMRALLAAMFVSSIPTTLLLPMMPALGTQFGVGPAELGLLVGVYPLMSMLASPFWGRLSDRYGRKPILICTLAGGAIAFLLFAFSTSWVGLLAGRAVQGLAGTPRGIGFAAASDMAGDEERSSSMGGVTAAMAIAFMVGPLIGGLFMGEDPDSWAGHLRSMVGLPDIGFIHVIPSLMGMVLNLIGILVIVLGFTETWRPAEASEQKKTSAIETHSFRVAIFHASVILAIAFFLLSGFIQNSLQFSFSLWADMRLGWSAQYIAWSGAFIGLGFAIGSGLVLKPMIRRAGQEKTVLIGAVLDALGLAAFLLLQASPLLALCGLLVSSLGGSLWATTILGLMSRQIDPRDQGLALGVANGASLFGRVLGPAFAGLMAGAIDPGTPFIIILGCVMLAVMRGATLVWQGRQR